MNVGDVLRRETQVSQGRREPEYLEVFRRPGARLRARSPRDAAASPAKRPVCLWPAHKGGLGSVLPILSVGSPSYQGSGPGQEIGATTPSQPNSL
jgi:hypothetical protein